MLFSVSGFFCDTTKMDLGQLRYFIKIVEHRSFTRAARDCTVSQPALSQQIAKLEKELGQPLFERQGRTIRLTSAGQTLQAEAEKILQLVDDVKGQITDDGQTGRICFSAIPTIGPYFLPESLKSVGGQFGKANFVISENVTDELLKRCSNGDIDVGVLALPAQAKYVTVEPLFEEELLLAVAADHPLATQKRVTSQDVMNEPFVLLDEAHCLVDAIQSFCNSQNFQPIATTRIQQLETVKNLVAMGHGVTFVPQMACRGDANGRLVYRSLDGEKPKRTIAICWNPYRYQSQLLGNFIKGLRELGDPTLPVKKSPPVPKAKMTVGS
jgi:LysR family hydrogen peroxide-inducible transcriptional activator